MDMTPQEYQSYVQQRMKKSPLLKDVCLSFVIGGAICVLGQAIQNGWAAAGLSKEDVRAARSSMSGWAATTASASGPRWCKS